MASRRRILDCRSPVDNVCVESHQLYFVILVFISYITLKTAANTDKFAIIYEMEMRLQEGGVLIERIPIKSA